MPKVKVKAHRLFIAHSTAQLIIDQRDRVAARFPDTPISELSLFPRERRNPRGTFATWAGKLAGAVREWVDNLPSLIGPAGEPFPRERVIPYAFRHSFAQRHADNGTPLDVLAAMMGHRTTDTTRGYYQVDKSRMRTAVARVSGLQINHRGNHVAADFAGLVDAESDRYRVGQIAVGFGTCHEPSNVSPPARAVPTGFAASAARTFAPTRPTCPSCARTCSGCSSITSASTPRPTGGSKTGRAATHCPPPRRSPRCAA